MNGSRVAIVLVALAGIMTGCTIRRERMLVGEIAQGIQTNPARVDLGRLYPAAWDRVCIVPPGTGGSLADSLLGFHYRHAGSLVARKDVTGLWFVQGRKVVSAVSYPRSQGDFAVAGRPYCRSRQQAVFRAELGTPNLPVVPID